LNNKLFKIGITGTAVSALCCFTPVLVWMLSALGMAAIIGYVDYVFLPALGLFILITGYALWRQRTQ